jgi:hypothetical protein
VKLADDIRTLAAIVRANPHAWEPHVLAEAGGHLDRWLAAYDRARAQAFAEATTEQPPTAAPITVHVHPTISVPAQAAPVVNVDMHELAEAIRAPRAKRIVHDDKGRPHEIRDITG